MTTGRLHGECIYTSGTFIEPVYVHAAVVSNKHTAQLHQRIRGSVSLVHKWYVKYRVCSRDKNFDVITEIVILTILRKKDVRMKLTARHDIVSIFTNLYGV